MTCPACLLRCNFDAADMNEKSSIAAGDLVNYIKALRGPVLITGASGFVGSNLFRMIRAERDDAFACIRREKGWRLADVPDDQLIAVDLNDDAATKNLVTSLKPQTVFHCAAYGAYSFEQEPGLIYQTDLAP